MYTKASWELACAELRVFNHRVLGGRVRDVERCEIGGVPYVGFTVQRDRHAVGRRLQLALTVDGIEIAFVNADTCRALEFFRPRSFDVLVADLPYGVQHGSRAAAGPSRGPIELVAQALPAWSQLLRAGGAVGLAWNTRVATREALAGALSAAGLEVADAEPYRGFRHRVDEAIVRDVVVARAP